MRGHHAPFAAAPPGCPGPGKKAAVVGLGGLGRVGVKFAHAMGPEVTVLSQSLKKTDERRVWAEAYERVLSSDVRYRFVIDIATLATTGNIEKSQRAM